MKKKRNGSQIPSNSKQPTKHKSELDHPLDATYPVAVYPHYFTHTQFLCPHKPNLLSLRSSLLCVSYPNNQSSIKKNIKTIFIFFSFQKTKRRRIKRTVQLSQRRRMKITALLVLKCNPDGSDPVVLATAMDVSHFGYFQRSSVKEFILFVARTVGKRTPPGQRQSVQHEGSIFNFRLQSVSLFF